jgi:hypothetical protein
MPFVENDSLNTTNSVSHCHLVRHENQSHLPFDLEQRRLRHSRLHLLLTWLRTTSMLGEGIELAHNNIVGGDDDIILLQLGSGEVSASTVVGAGRKCAGCNVFLHLRLPVREYR